MTSLTRRFASNILVPLAIAVGALVALEAGCRGALRVKRGEWPVTRAESYTRFVEKVGACYRPHPFLVVAGRPGATLKVEGHEVRLNSRGERSPEPEMPKPAGRFRVVCEGGSTTYDLLVSKNEASWPFKLGEALAPKNGDVVNAGFPGWTSVESLVSLQLRDVDLSPDLVVVYSGINDLQPAGHVPFARDYALGHGEILPRVLGVSGVPLRLAARSVLVEWLLDRIAPRRAKEAEGFAPAWQWAGGARKDDIPPDAAAVYERNLRSTVAVAKAHGARTLLVAQTVVFRKKNEAWDREYVESWTPGLTADGYRRGLARYNEAARGLASEGLCLFVDPFAGGAFGDDDFADAVHFDDAGSAKFAAFLAERIAPLLPARN